MWEQTGQASNLFSFLWLQWDEHGWWRREGKAKRRRVQFTWKHHDAASEACSCKYLQPFVGGGRESRAAARPDHPLSHSEVSAELKALPEPVLHPTGLTLRLWCNRQACWILSAPCHFNSFFLLFVTACIYMLTAHTIINDFRTAYKSVCLQKPQRKHERLGRAQLRKRQDST